ncbi:MAG: metal-binding protein [Rhodocyclaceae bacterium]|nr:metal-binding protein [Rhodocyclaceae bacterium]
MVVSSPIIDSLEFSRQGRNMEGRVAASDLPRLADSLADAGSVLSWRLWGEKDEEGKLFLVLTVEGVLSLTCQRCLANMTWPLDITERLLLVPEGTPWPEDELEDDSLDAIAAEREMSVLTLVEDEVLLALPAVPRHAEQALCQAPVAVNEDLPASPFALLEQLKKKH